LQGLNKIRRPLFAGSAVALLMTGCVVSGSDEQTAAADSAAASQAAQVPAPVTMPAMPDSAAMALPETPVSDMRLEVDLAARKLYAYKGSARVATHSVAVGSKEWPTKTGEWKVTQVVFNPEWIPPDETWAEEREPRKSGDPKNPLGRIQLVYDPPRSIHGTNAPASIGTAVSHGSIRVTNAVGLEVAKQLLESAGVGKDAAWYRNASQNRSVKQVVDLPGGVPIKVF